MKINVEFNSVEEMQDFAKLIGTPCNCNGVKVEIGAPTVEEGKKEDNSKSNKKSTSKKAEKAKEEVKENHTNPVKENESIRVAENDMYFYHPESDSYWSLPKGEKLPTGIDYEVSHEITKEEYEKGIDNQKKEPNKEEPKVTKETIRAAFAKLIKAGKAKEAKDITAKYGANKVPDLKEEDYASVLKEVEALL